MIRPLLSVFIGLSLLTGLVYPALITGVAQAVWPHQANGSVWAVEGKPAGSALIGQSFTAAGQFWGRPSATSDKPYNALASGGSNLGANNPALLDAVKARAQALRAADPGAGADLGADANGPIPIDLLTASGSGLDPEISLAAALWQVPRVAKARGLPEDTVRAKVEQLAQRPFIGAFGEPRINVLALNLALEGKVPVPQR